MTGLERLLACIEGKEGDRVPVCELFLGAAHRVYGARFDEFSMEGEIAGKSWVASQELIGFDIHVLLWDLTVEAHDFGQETELFVELFLDVLGQLAVIFPESFRQNDPDVTHSATPGLYQSLLPRPQCTVRLANPRRIFASVPGPPGHRNRRAVREIP